MLLGRVNIGQGTPWLVDLHTRIVHDSIDTVLGLRTRGCFQTGSHGAPDVGAACMDVAGETNKGGFEFVGLVPAGFSAGTPPCAYA